MRISRVKGMDIVSPLLITARDLFLDFMLLFMVWTLIIIQSTGKDSMLILLREKGKLNTFYLVLRSELYEWGLKYFNFLKLTSAQSRVGRCAVPCWLKKPDINSFFIQWRPTMNVKSLIRIFIFWSLVISLSACAPAFQMNFMSADPDQNITARIGKVDIVETQTAGESIKTLSLRAAGLVGHVFFRIIQNLRVIVIRWWWK